jgi:hypothetical protein
MLIYLNPNLGEESLTPLQNWTERVSLWVYLLVVEDGNNVTM